MTSLSHSRAEVVVCWVGGLSMQLQRRCSRVIGFGDLSTRLDASQAKNQQRTSDNLKRLSSHRCARLEHVPRRHHTHCLPVLASHLYFIARTARSGYAIPAESPRQTTQALFRSRRDYTVQLDFYLPSHIARALSRAASRWLLGHGTFAEYVF